MPVYVEVAVIIPRVTGTFSYHLPTSLEGRISPGSLVTVPFGSQHVQGIVTRLLAEPDVPETRPVEDLVDELPVVTAAQMQLAAWLAHETLSPLSACLDAMIPPGLSQHVDTLIQPMMKEKTHLPAGLSQVETRLFGLLNDRGALRGRQVETALPQQNWKAAVKSLEKKGLVATSSYLPPPSVRPKFIKTAQLSIPPEKIDEYLNQLGRQTAVIQRRLAVLKFLATEPWPVDIAWVYAASHASLADLQKLEETGLIRLSESEVWRDPLKEMDAPLINAPDLTDDQQKAWTSLQEILSAAYRGIAPKPVLLNGVTGSGKTEMYLKAIQDVITRGDQALYLIPEISLTPQTIKRVLGRFPGRVGIIHSRLSAGERYDTWRRARSGSLSVIIGPRSALFTPLPRLGLIVVDECHDDSYYQSDILPYYHAVSAALAYARLSGALCILGSATPAITTTFQASHGSLRYLHLPTRILAHREAVRLQMNHAHLTATQYRALEGEAETIDLPKVHVVDMRDELKSGNRSIFSQSLQLALGQVLELNQQAILFLNRRGTATYVFCRNCGYTLKCPRCDLPLTYHIEQARDLLLCHYCGYQRILPGSCPECGSQQIRHYGTGTERVEAELLKLFPAARCLRWDYETTRQKGAHEVILGHFAAQRADILIGTQMIAKGLDLPLVTLVGVVLADVGLSLPDYRSAERSFQILAQVAGRAGRGPLGGQVILQTFQPEHYVIRAAAQHSYREFYQRELDFRRKLGYPPFSKVVRLEFRHSDSVAAENSARQLSDEIHKWLAEAGDNSTEMIGPAPCFFQRIGGLYRWQIVLRGPDPSILFREHKLEQWKIEVNPPNLL